MTADKIEKLESQFNELNKNFGKIEGTLINIERLLSIAVGMNETVITQKEKHKVSENRIQKIEENYITKGVYDKSEERMNKMQENINGINLKIAMVSGAWTVVLYMISKMN